MAKKPDTSASTRPQEPETLNGSNTLPATIEISEGHSVQLGTIVSAAYQNSGLSVAAWNALPEAERDELLNQVIADFKATAVIESLPEEMKANLAEAAAGAAQGVTSALEERQPDIQMMVAEQVLIVSAPGGPRRRAGFSFGPVPVELRAEDLGDDPKAALEALRADPMLKIDGRFEEHPAE